MFTSPEYDRHTTLADRLLPVFQSLIAFLTAVLAFLAEERIWKLFAILSAFAVFSLVLRLGWTVPCMICGAVTGIFCDTAIKGGTYESQMWETVRLIFGGAFLGMSIGWMIDSMHGSTPDDHEINT